MAKGASQLTSEDVRRMARLARLALSDEAVEDHRRHLAAVLDHMEILRGVDVRGVQPMAHAGDDAAAPAADEPGRLLPREVLMRMAPAAEPPFIRVPKVLGDEGGAS